MATQVRRTKAKAKVGVLGPRAWKAQTEPLVKSESYPNWEGTEPIAIKVRRSQCDVARG